MSPELIKALAKYGPLQAGFFALLYMIYTILMGDIAEMKNNQEKLYQVMSHSNLLLESIESGIRENNLLHKRTYGYGN